MLIIIYYWLPAKKIASLYNFSGGEVFTALYNFSGGEVFTADETELFNSSGSSGLLR